jgi:hypothetical protein
MTDKLISNAVKLLLDNVIDRYNSYGNQIKIDNCGASVIKKISLSVETAFKLQGKYIKENPINKDYASLVLFIQYQCKRELIVGDIQTFSETFDVDSEQLQNIKNFVGNRVSLRAFVVNQDTPNPNVVVSHNVNLARCCKVHREAGWYIANAVEEVVKLYMPQFEYAHGMTLEQMVKYTNERLKEYEQEQEQLTGYNMHSCLINYLGW